MIYYLHFIDRGTKAPHPQIQDPPKQASVKAGFKDKQ